MTDRMSGDSFDDETMIFALEFALVAADCDSNDDDAHLVLPRWPWTIVAMITSRSKSTIAALLD